MQVTYSLSQQDIRQAQLVADHACRAKVRRPFGLRLLVMAVVAALVLFGAASLGMYQKYPGPITSDLSWVVLSAAVAFLGIFLLVIWSKRNFENARLAEMAPFPIEQTLSVESSGLRIEGQNGSCFLPWRLIRTVEELPEHLAITTAQWFAFVIPNSAFGSETERSELSNELRQHISP